MNSELRITHRNNKSFTLIELLVVLALVAILSVVVILTLNPAELIKQARDSNRLSDLATINTALNLFSADVTSGFMGTSTVVYISIPSTTSTCSNLGLPTLPTGYTYNCVTATSTRNTDGTGWIPVNFQRISSNSPISQLPIDPINTTSTRLYYSYIPGGSWELNATIEATKNKLGGSNDLTSKDGGSAISTYEVGNNLTLNPIETGDVALVGYWNFENDVLDHSGYGNNGTWIGTSTGRYTTGKVGNYSGYFNGSSDYINCGTSSALSFPDNIFTFSVWIKVSSGWGGVLGKGGTPWEYGMQASQHNLVAWTSAGANVYSWNNYFPDNSYNIWINYTWVADGNKIYGYENGTLTGTYNKSPGVSMATTIAPMTIGASYGYGNLMNGLIDNLRIYNRALSAAEVLGLYNATK